MTVFYLTGGCRFCRGEVEIITFRDKKKVECISHGVCTMCLKNVTMPNEPVYSLKGTGILFTKKGMN